MCIELPQQGLPQTIPLHRPHLHRKALNKITVMHHRQNRAFNLLERQVRQTGLALTARQIIKRLETLTVIETVPTATKSTKVDFVAVGVNPFAGIKSGE